MPNHFHLLVLIKYDRQEKTLNNGIAVLLRSYTRAIQKQRNLVGSLFQPRTRAQEIGNDRQHGLNHAAVCMHYIHQNPLRSGLVSSMDLWQFSSYRDYAGLRNGTLCNRDLGLMMTGITEENFINESHEVINFDEKTILR
jgi:putative transposase